MNILEISQVFFNITLSIVSIAITIILVTIGLAVYKLLISMKEGIEMVKKESIDIKEHIRKILNELSFANIITNIGSWFKKIKKTKKS